MRILLVCSQSCAGLLMGVTQLQINMRIVSNFLLVFGYIVVLMTM